MRHKRRVIKGPSPRVVTSVGPLATPAVVTRVPLDKGAPINGERERLLAHRGLVGIPALQARGRQSIVAGFHGLLWLGGGWYLRFMVVWVKLDCTYGAGTSWRWLLNTVNASLPRARHILARGPLTMRGKWARPTTGNGDRPLPKCRNVPSLHVMGAVDIFCRPVCSGVADSGGPTGLLNLASMEPTRHSQLSSSASHWGKDAFPAPAGSRARQSSLRRRVARDRARTDGRSQPQRTSAGRHEA